MAWRIGVDIGGTFTDIALVEEETGRVGIVKVPTFGRRSKIEAFYGKLLRWNE
jgi:N-methylhydantoinase A